MCKLACTYGCSSFFVLWSVSLNNPSRQIASFTFHPSSRRHFSLWLFPSGDADAWTSLALTHTHSHWWCSTGRTHQPTATGVRVVVLLVVLLSNESIVPLWTASWFNLVTLVTVRVVRAPRKAPALHQLMHTRVWGMSFSLLLSGLFCPVRSFWLFFSLHWPYNDSFVV